jgi:hypothetical protein
MKDDDLRRAVAAYICTLPDGFRSGDADHIRTTDYIMALIRQDRRELETAAKIEGINEAHKEILEIVYTYTGGEGLENFCDVDDVSRVAMSWKIDRIKELQHLTGLDEGEADHE